MFPFLADAVSYALSVITLAGIRTPLQDERPPKALNVRAEIAEGVSWLWRHQLIRFTVLLNGGINLVFSSLSLTVIVLIQHQFELTPRVAPVAIGVAFAVGSVGGIGGSLVGPVLSRRFSYGQIAITALTLSALTWPLLMIATSPLTIGAVVLAIEAMVCVYDMTQFSYRLALIPDALQGRVNSVFRLGPFSGRLIGSALTGFLIQTITVRPTVLVFGGILALVALATALNPNMRHVPRRALQSD